MCEIPEPIRVLIADRSPIVLEGLSTLLKRCPDIQVIGEATDGAETVEKAAHLQPHVILLESALLKLEGWGVLRGIQTWAPQAKTILFASGEDRDSILEALKLGCSGILFKYAPPELIEKSIHKVHAGELWLDSATTTAIIRRFARPGEPPSARRNGKSNGYAQLTRREREVVSWIACGCKNKEIAERISAKEQTVKNHVHNIFEKLGISDRL